MHVGRKTIKEIGKITKFGPKNAAKYGEIFRQSFQISYIYITCGNSYHVFGSKKQEFPGVIQLYILLFCQCYYVFFRKFRGSPR